jgi:purine-binding chemotaxis protein CheW
VTLGIEREVFGVPVDSVLEILDMQPVFRVPEAPAYMLGLIDLRGRSVPVLDLRTKLGLPSVAPTETTRILVLEV